VFVFRTILICAALLMPCALSAQLFRGVVKDAGSNAPMYPVSVFNKNKNISTVTNHSGQFAITAEVGDQLILTYLGYETKEFTVSNISTIVTTNIYMAPKDYQLKEFVFDGRLTPYQKDSIYRSEVYEKANNWAPSGGLMSPVSLLAETISGKRKSMRNFQKSFKYWENQNYIDTRYTDELVAEQTGLKGDSLANFKNLYPMPADYARTATSIELKMWIRYNFRDWKSKGRPMIFTELPEMESKNQ